MYFKHLIILISEITKKSVSLHISSTECLLEIIRKGSTGVLDQLEQMFVNRTIYSSDAKPYLRVSVSWLKFMLVLVANNIHDYLRNKQNYLSLNLAPENRLPQEIILCRLFTVSTGIQEVISFLHLFEINQCDL